MAVLVALQEVKTSVVSTLLASLAPKHWDWLLVSRGIPTWRLVTYPVKFNGWNMQPIYCWWQPDIRRENQLRLVVYPTLGFNTLQAVQDFFHQQNIIINEYQNITSSKFSESFPFEDFQWSGFSSLIHWLFGGGSYMLLWPVYAYLKHPKPIIYIWSQRNETSKQCCISSIVTYHQTLSWWQPLGPCLLGVHTVVMFVIHSHNSPYILQEKSKFIRIKRHHHKTPNIWRKYHLN